MKIFLISTLLLQCLLNEARANLNGQTNAKVPLLNDDGTTTGTAITCSPYSVEDDTYDVEYVKYVLNTEEEGISTVIWNPQPNKTLFDQCASYAAETNAKMFYFDGDTCQTSDTIYERKEKTCNSTAVKMVYMQKAFELDPSNCNEGEEWQTILPCAVSGRKRCENAAIISERLHGTSFIQHMENVDYIPITSGCLIKPQNKLTDLSSSKQYEKCSEVGAVPCDPPSGVDSNTFTDELKDFMDTSLGTVYVKILAINLRKNSTNQLNWNDSPSTPSHFADIVNDGWDCFGLSKNYPHDLVIDICGNPWTNKICCMLKEST